jgi:hypothetical protein
MPAFYKIDKERELVMTTYSGVLTIAEALGHQERLPKDPDFDPSFSQLFDVTHVTDVQLTAERFIVCATRKVSDPSWRTDFKVSMSGNRRKNQWVAKHQR